MSVQDDKQIAKEIMIALIERGAVPCLFYGDQAKEGKLPESQHFESVWKRIVKAVSEE